MEEFRGLYSENFALISESGFCKPYCNVTLDDRVIVRKMLCLHQVITKCLAELQQFLSGLESLGVLQSMKKYPHLFRSYFVREQLLTVG